MSSKGSGLESTSISNWLAELHMECYKKYLEDYGTLRALMDIKETELKKLGISNSRDRAAMLSSLANYRTVIDGNNSGPSQQSQDIETSHQKSLLRKGSLKKLNLKGVKGLLGSGGAKKSKKRAESVIITDSSALTSSTPSPLQRTYSVDRRPLSPITSTPPPSSNRMARQPSIPDYEELPDDFPNEPPKLFQVKVQPQPRKAIENEYVPSPQGSPQFTHRMRAHTISECLSPPVVDHTPWRSAGEFIGGQTEFVAQELEPQDEAEGLQKHKHLSVISMESGLSFGYDIDKDFSPHLPLDSQPWYHGRINRNESEGFLHDDGDFLVRENVTMPDTYTLSMRWRGKCDHTLICTTEVVNSQRGKGVKYHFEGGAFDSVPELIYNHLKYQIPIDQDIQSLLVTPVCRAGMVTKGVGYGAVVDSGEVSPTQFYTLPKNFGSHSSQKPKVNRSTTPEPHRHMNIRSTKSVTFSPNGSPHSSPAHEALKYSNSIGNIIDEHHVYHERNAVSPPPSIYPPGDLAVGEESRHRAATVSGGRPYSEEHGRQGRLESSDDYELMESVSILEMSPTLSRAHLGQHTPPSAASSSSSLHSFGREPVKYAELKCHQRNSRGSTPPSANRGSRLSVVSGGPSVKYAEVRFCKPGQPTSSASPHPFSVYDSVPPPIQSPYQSRAELLAQKVQNEATYAIPKTRSNVSRMESSPHPFSQDSTAVSISRQISAPTVAKSELSLHTTATSVVSTIPIAQVDTSMYSLPDRSKLHKSRAHQRDSALSTGSAGELSYSVTGKAASAPAVSVKVPKVLPGYESLAKLHGLLASHSTEDLACHLTQADAVQFLLSPRPGEDANVWKKRVQSITSSSGVFVGLQTLADRDGEKLWKKLYHRHLALSQMVSLSLLSAGDLQERLKTLKRFIELAFLLQSSNYGNLFSFMSVMQGIVAQQVTEMTEVWSSLQTHFPDTATSYKELQGTFAAINKGTSNYDPEHLSIPAIQHLKTVFHFEEPTLPGQAAQLEDRGLVAEFSNLSTGMDGIRMIVQNCSQFAFNTRKMLRDSSINAALLDFFTQDYPRNYLQAMGVHEDDPMERRRRLCVIMDALVDRVTKMDSST